MKDSTKKTRALRLVRYLKKVYGAPKTELNYTEPHELLFAVMLSAQCTDKRVNIVTKKLFKKYTSLKEFAGASLDELRKDIASVSYPNNKAKHIIETAKMLVSRFEGKIPRDMKDLVQLYGVARKTANVVRGELYNEFDGIAIDTHVKRFVRKFDLSKASSADAIERDLMALVPKKDWKYVNNGLVLYGRYVCTAIKHDCSSHGLTKIWPEAASRWPRAI